MSIFDSENFDEVWNSIIGETFSCKFEDMEVEKSEGDIVQTMFDF